MATRQDLICQIECRFGQPLSQVPGFIYFDLEKRHGKPFVIFYAGEGTNIASFFGQVSRIIPPDYMPKLTRRFEFERAA